MTWDDLTLYKLIFFREDSDDGDEHKHLKAVLDNGDLHASEELVVRRDVSNSDRIGLNIVGTSCQLENEENALEERDYHHVQIAGLICINRWRLTM
jgi:hypothetical protein